MNKKTSREEKAKFWKAQMESIIKYEIGSKQLKFYENLFWNMGGSRVVPVFLQD